MSHAQTQPRELSGTPTGGQWTTAPKAEAEGVTLTDEPTMSERISQAAADIDRRFDELKAERERLKEAELAAAVVDIAPNAHILRMEVQVLPAYHSGEVEGRRYFLEELLDADGNRIEVDEGDQDYIDDCIDEYSSAQDDLHHLSEGTIKDVDLTATLAPYRS